MIIKNEEELNNLRVAGKIVGDTHNYLKQFIKPGITTKELDTLAYDFIIKNDATPSFLNYSGYPASICISINEEVVHGIPSSRKLKKGDIISIDIGACYKGYHGDSAWTYKVGSVTKEKEYLMIHTEKSLYEGLKAVKPGNHVGDIGYMVESYAKKHKLGVVKELVGHGVGTHLHEKPDVPNFGRPHSGEELVEGMVIAIEPMLNLGTAQVFILDDDWTIVTGDDKPSAHYEHTIVVTKDGYEILTKR